MGIGTMTAVCDLGCGAEDIKEYDAFTAKYSGICGANGGDNVTWSLDTTKDILRITGTGKMDFYAIGSAPWYEYRSDIKTLIMDDAITNVGQCAFYGCTSLTAVTEIPASVTNMSYAFAGCTALTGEVVIQASPSTYGGCFEYTALPITLSGSSTVLAELAATSSNGNVTVK